MWLPVLVWSIALALAACGRFGVRATLQQGTPAADGGTKPDPGGCSGVCPTYHGVMDCQSGECALSCENGYANCDGRSYNGCETSVMDAAGTCGSCALACDNAHGTTACEQGVCVPSCSGEYGDCDSDPNNGCESRLDDVEHCRGCGVVCTNAHGSTSCEADGCAPSCDADFADCDAMPDNGCETDLRTNPAHCGSCANACDVATQLCNAGRCELSPCGPGRAECDDNSQVACETDLTSSADNCGSCGNVCVAANGSGQCMDSACAISSCAGGFADCDGSFANGCEVTLASSTSHCGACGAACNNDHGTTRCEGSSCVPTCSTGYGDCDGDLANGCETALDTVTNCGVCGRACPDAGGTPFCNAGVCSTHCDLSGNFAFKLSVPVTWSGTSVLLAGSGTFVFWAQLQLTQNGDTLSGSLVPCGERVPDFAAPVPISENYRVTLPTNALDAASFPSTTISATLSDTSPGSSLDVARAAWLLGASLDDPAYDTWPSRTAVNQLDADADGKLGVTYVYANGGGYSFVPVDGLGIARASRGYIASRVVFGLSGTLTSCTQSSGDASVPDVDAHTLGCQLSSGSSCSSTQSGYLDSNAPDWRPQAASYALAKLSVSATCADVRAALP